MEYVTDKRRTLVEEKRIKGCLPDVRDGGEWRRRCETSASSGSEPVTGWQL
ncbi:hypothetical protein HanPSC8_Chr09g0354991 [Helianthus annuus]|nr:hypothetical protein HanPSC8_Chr09g0354991 [Helianthus annuus]